MKTFTQLPNDILYLITNHLHQSDIFQCALVCRSLYKTLNPCLWESPTIRDHRAATAFLRTLSAASKRHRDEPPSSRTPLVQYIDHITLHSTKFWTDTSLTRLIHLTKRNLTRLSLLNLKLVTNASIKTLTQLPHSKLQQLDVTGCTHFSWQIFKLLAKLPCLTSLTVTMNHIQEAGRRQHGKDTTMDLLQLRHLKELQLDNISRYFMKDIVRALTLTTTTQQPIWPHLTKLTLNGYSMTDQLMRQFFQHHGQLKLTRLCLVNLGISDQSLKTVASRLASTLTYVDISGNKRMTADGIRQLIRSCLSLEHIHMENCGINTSSFPELAPGGGGDMLLHDLDQRHIQCIRFANDSTVC